MSNQTNNPYSAPSASLASNTGLAANALAGLWRRFFAALIDLALEISVNILLVYVFVRFFSQTFQQIKSLPVSLVVVGFTVRMLLFLVMNGYLLAERGQTIGKFICSIRIVRSDGNEPNLGYLLFRRYIPVWLLVSVPVVGTVLQILEALFVFRPSRKCLHDELADTMVVAVPRERS